MRSSLPAKLTTIEYAADGSSSRMFRDGKEVARPAIADLPELPSPSFAALIPPRPRPVHERRTAPGSGGRRSSILGLLLPPDSGASVRESLLRGFGPSSPIGVDQERFTRSTGDTVRSITCSRRYGTITEVRVEIGGRVHATTRYELGELTPGVFGRTAMVLVRAMQ